MYYQHHPFAIIKKEACKDGYSLTTDHSPAITESLLCRMYSIKKEPDWTSTEKYFYCHFR